MWLRLASVLLWKKNRMPVYLIHSVTERCNARCTHCFVDKDCGKREMTIAEIQSMCDSMGKDLFHVCLSGGEPFLRVDLPEIARAYFERTPTHVIRISTNGFFTDRVVKSAEKILEMSSCRNLVIEISLDDIGALHDKIRVLDGSFAHAVETYRQLAKLERRYDNFFVNVNITVCRSNQSRLLQLYHHLKKDLGIENVSITLTRGTPDQPIEKNVDIKEYERLVSVVESDLTDQSVPGYSGLLHGYLVNAQNILARQRIIETVLKNRFISRCYAGNLAGVVESDGRLRPCELRPEVFGNVRETNVAELWLSKGASDFQSACATCYCTHECFLAPTIVFNPRYAPQLAFMAGKMWAQNRVRRARRFIRSVKKEERVSARGAGADA